MLNRFVKSAFIIGLLFLSACHKSDNQSLKICFAGDLLLDRGVRQRIEHSGIDPLFSHVSSLFKGSDAVVANLECAVTYKQAPLNKRFIFRGDPAWLSAVKNSGITHLTMANNHVYDQGRDGIIDTYKQLIYHHLIPIGFGNNQAEACLPVIIKKGETEVAIFNSVLIPLENFPYLPYRPCICQADPDNLADAIADYKLIHPKSFVIVVLHWGFEYQSRPEPSQRVEAARLIASGADAIIGQHSHVIQSIGFIKNKPVIYSLGNFIFDSRRPEASQGLIVQLTISKGELAFTGFKIRIKDCIPEITNNTIKIENGMQSIFQYLD